MKRPIVILSLVFVCQFAAGQSKPKDDIERVLDTVTAGLGESWNGGSEVFGGFLDRLATESSKAGNRRLQQQILALRRDRKVPAELHALASRILRRYIIARYADAMVKDLQTLIGFRTHAVPGSKNWDLPEFLRQREWLQNRSRDLGLGFKSYHGRVDEISLASGDSILALLTHGDVQPVEGQTWNSPPWGAPPVGGKVIGRGAEDDKGPIIVALYVLKGLKDTGWRLNSSVHLLIANGEESDWSDIPYYLQHAKMPNRTLGIDASYPVTSAQKGFGIGTFRSRGKSQQNGTGGWRVLSIGGGSGLSIIPASGQAILKYEGPSGEGDNELNDKTVRWSREHPPAMIEVSPESDGGFIVKARGTGGHSSVPANGHNALGDLTAFLATLDLVPDSRGALVKFIGTHVGIETNGKSLGIARSDTLLGELTFNLALIAEDSLGLYARSSLRIVQGFRRGEIDSLLRLKAKEFEATTGAGIDIVFQEAAGPHVAEAGLVTALLGVWKDVMGMDGRPLAIGGGTQARLFRNGVDFGPGFPGQIYRGHAPDEYLTVDELMTIAELTTAAVWQLCGGSD